MNPTEAKAYINPSVFDEEKFLDEWTARLRSGEYAQTTGTLKDANGMCCIGVAAVCMRDTQPEALKAAGVRVSEAWNMVTVSLGDYSSPENLPWTVPGCLQSSFLKSAMATLPSLNDKAGLTFEQIADLIDRARASADPGRVLKDAYKTLVPYA